MSAFLICEKCGYETDEPVVEGGSTYTVGRCCKNLPQPYEFSAAAGTYSATHEQLRAERQSRVYRDPVPSGWTDDATSPDTVDDALGLNDDDYDNACELYQNHSPNYMSFIQGLGW